MKSIVASHNSAEYPLRLRIQSTLSFTKRKSLLILRTSF
nr:MAG TPA: hypothetical protein [Bacteriophage sp.]DAT29116.1 MAG TPA: hypothetical protein [Caudoviricetes sp.]